LDLKPTLPLPLEMIEESPAIHREPSPILDKILTQLQLLSPLFDPLPDILRDISSITELVKRHEEDEGFWKDGIAATKLLGPVNYQLLSMPKLPDLLEGVQLHRYSLLAELIRLTCILILASLKHRFLLNPCESRPTLIRVKRLLDTNLVVPPNQPDLLDLHLWALLSIYSLQDKNETSYLLNHIHSSMKAKGISAMHAAIDVAKTIIWMGDVSETEANL
jgi:hypothetical protein